MRPLIFTHSLVNFGSNGPRSRGWVDFVRAVEAWIRVKFKMASEM